MKILKDFLEIHAYSLNYDGRQFYSHLNRYLEGKVKRNELDESLTKILELTRNPPVNSLIIVNSQDDGETDVKDEKEENARVQNKTFDLVQRLKECDDDFVVSVSTEKEEISVWDIQK